MKYFSLFTGAGGFEIGIHAASPCFECVGMSEIDERASAVLKHRFPEVNNYGDIKTIDWSDVPDFDLLVGGSPCQDLSIAGKRVGLEGSRSGLFVEYVRALQEKKPRYFLWENVKGALSSNGGRDFAVILHALAEAGYVLWWQVLNAKDFNVPQSRERIFVFGSRDGSLPEVFFERGSIKSDTDGRIVAGTLTARYPASQREGAYIEETRKQSGAGKTVALTERRTKAAKLIRRKMMRQGRDWSPRRGKELVPRTDDIGNSVTATQGKEHLLFDGTSRIRKLTPKECERLMSWPDDWTRWGVDKHGRKIEISDAQRYKMCGNGVVSKVVEKIIKTLCNTNP